MLLHITQSHVVYIGHSMQWMQYTVDAVNAGKAVGTVSLVQKGHIHRELNPMQ